MPLLQVRLEPRKSRWEKVCDAEFPPLAQLIGMRGPHDGARGVFREQLTASATRSGTSVNRCHDRNREKLAFA
jgi:hypothetical protein